MLNRFSSQVKTSYLLALLGVVLTFHPSASYAQVDPLTGFIDSFTTTMTTALTSAASTLLGMGLADLNSQIAAFWNDLFGLGPCADNGTLSDVLCNVMKASDGLPGFVTAMSYIMGLVLTLVALFKLKDHVLNPNQVPISDAVKRFIAGGALFSLPMITEAAQNLLTGGNNAMSEVSVYNIQSTSAGFGLDSMMMALFMDIYTPLMSVIFAFAYLAGLVLTVVGISRLIKTAQDGPRGPASLGTVMCFVVAGVLFSLSTIMASFSTSMFMTSTVAVYAEFADGIGTGDAAVNGHIINIISTVLVFMTIIGYISFLRGFFILKDVAEGSGQASLMAAMTHIFGGALAVNLGPLMNAVQSTLGLESMGIMFS